MIFKLIQGALVKRNFTCHKKESGRDIKKYLKKTNLLFKGLKIYLKDKSSSALNKAF